MSVTRTTRGIKGDPPVRYLEHVCSCGDVYGAQGECSECLDREAAGWRQEHGDHS